MSGRDHGLEGSNRRSAPAPAAAQRRLRSAPQANGAGSLLALQRSAGNGAIARLARSKGRRELRRMAIDPAAEFPPGGPVRAADDVDSAIDAATDSLTGFGGVVDGRRWSTKVTFDPLVTPGPVAAPGMPDMEPEGSGAHGVIGPDHPYGSQPRSPTALANNGTAAVLRPAGTYVAAHIVNDQLGGPGDAQNLFAFPMTANTAMEKRVEKRMKEAVATGHYIWYQATVHHPAEGPADYITMSWNKLGEDGADLGGGQTDVRIDWDVAGPGGDLNLDAAAAGAAARLGLGHPSNPTNIYGAPWFPYQMPDPKNNEVPAFLDFARFPAVGNAKAFEQLLEGFKKLDQLPLFFEAFVTSEHGERACRDLADRINRRHVKDKKQPRERGRGVTKQAITGLKSPMKSPDALLTIIKADSDALRKAAKLFAREARDAVNAQYP